MQQRHPAEKPVTLKDFNQKSGMPIHEKVAFLARELDVQIRNGLSLRRPALSPMDRRVTIQDRAGGATRELAMFGSNNYLGLANHPEILSRMESHIKRFGIGLTGSPILNGTTLLHQMLEGRLSELKRSEACMIYTSGFAANAGTITALVDKGDALILDECAHASIIWGARSTKGKRYIFRHNDADHLEYLLKRAGQEGHTNKFVLVEGVYSMEGDIPPLDRIHAATRSQGGFLIVDDAHATGVLGQNGRGSAEHFDLEGEVDLVVGTFSKSLGSAGGFVCGKRAFIEYLRLLSRPYFFSASPPPVVVAQVMAALEIMAASPELRQSLMRNVDYIVQGLSRVGITTRTDSAIIPVSVPEGADIRSMSRQMEEAGIFVNHIEYPAVPLDRQRFRISVMATHTREDMDLLIGAFARVYGHWGLLERGSGVADQLIPS